MTMEKIFAVRYLLARRRDAVKRLRWRRKQSFRRRRAFAEKQAQERVMFMCLLAVVACNLQGSGVRTQWAKERSSHWWEQVVNSTFTPRDWLENFRMCRETFLYLCDKLRSSIAKMDTTMRNAVPVEQRVALTLWFLSTGTDYRTIGHLFGVIQVNCMCSHQGSLCFHRPMYATRLCTSAYRSSSGGGG